MTMESNNNPISRRDFLKRSAGAAITAGASVAGGLYFWNRNPVPHKPATMEVRRFDVAGTEGRFAVAKNDNIIKLVRRAVEGVGGIEGFIQKGDKVLIKVNGAFARPAWMGATTSPEVTAEVVKLCLEAGASSVRVTDNPISDAKSCFLKSGIEEAVKQAGGEVVLPRPADFEMVKVSEGVIGVWETFYRPLAWCDKLIGIPAVKTHNLCGASLTMKNWYGFMGGSRSRFHQDIHNVIAELGAFIRPTLIVLDGSRLLIRNGPTGGSASDVVPGNTIVATTDQVAADSFGVELLGLERSVVSYIQIAESMGLGKADYRALAGYREV
jgi:uncharacterized protein (DUF362 family)